MRRCFQCGREASDGVRVCDGCGAPLEMNPADVSPAPESPHLATSIARGDAPSTQTPGAFSPFPSPSDSHKHEEYFGPWGFFRKHWNGDYSLARSYWGNTILVQFFIVGLNVAFAALAKDRPARFASAAVLLITVLAHAAWVWAARGTWVSATKHELAGKSFGMLAKTMIVLGALRVTSDLIRQGDGLAEHFQVALGRMSGPPFFIQVGADGESLRFSGGMNDGAADALKRALDLALNVKSVTLNSPGGWVQEGVRVGKLISERNLSTFVDEHCSSACTLAFLAGKERTIGPRAQLGFHQVRTIGSAPDERSSDIRETFATYEAAGLSSDFIEKVVSIAPDEMWYPTAPELFAAHVATASTEWEEGRAELTDSFRASLTESLSSFALPSDAFEALLNCEVSAQIKWLSKTGCSNFYDPDLKTAEQHDRALSSCLEKAGMNSHMEEIELECSKAHLPNDWAVMEPRFANMFAADLHADSAAAPLAEKYGKCMARRYIQVLEATGCKPLNTDASTNDELFDDSECVDPHRKALDRKLKAMMRECSKVFDRP